MTMTMPNYDARLSRAGVVHVRRARDEDWVPLRALHEGLSPRSTFLRFFTATVNSERELRRLLRPVDDNHETVVALIDNEIAGVANYERIDAHSAEVAFLVGAPHRGIGLATLLLDVLADAARRNGITRFVAETLWENRPMLSVFRDCGLRCETSYVDGVMHVEIPLTGFGDAATGAAVVDAVNPPLGSHARERVP